MKELKQSIKHWEEIVKKIEEKEDGCVNVSEISSSSCPLCQKYLKERLKVSDCTGCPIAKCSGHDDAYCCEEWQRVYVSQYDWNHYKKEERLESAQMMLELLRRLESEVSCD